MNLMIRQHVTPSKELLYKADKACMIQLWIPRRLSADQYDYDASVVFASLSEQEATIEDGTPLLFDTKITLYLQPSEEVWLVTSNEAYCGAIVTSDEAAEV